eukprot:Gregarina_sp_Poly_1__9241@NODE_570_length_7488_cov_15_500606_g447_i0_p4_GENE_NODE_570_length_7488_cov_15_500606_g447_i0NODE_570_length_7488_cov_15_500606_g447_i0_p4_ORF_typecomplete_len105_score11_75_NODE_570_length_7488_cov_15_500606_g447_i0272586
MNLNYFAAGEKLPPNTRFRKEPEMEMFERLIYRMRSSRDSSSIQLPIHLSNYIQPPFYFLASRALTEKEISITQMHFRHVILRAIQVTNVSENVIRTAAIELPI